MALIFQRPKVLLRNPGGSEKEALRCWRHGAQTFSQTPMTRFRQLAVQARDLK